MRTITIFLLLTTSAMAQQQCAGPGCPTYIAPMGDDSDLDKAIIACNAHARGGIAAGTFAPGFEGCADVHRMWLGSPAHEKYLSEMRQRHAAVPKAQAQAPRTETPEEVEKLNRDRAAVDKVTRGNARP